MDNIARRSTCGVHKASIKGREGQYCQQKCKSSYTVKIPKAVVDNIFSGSVCGVSTCRFTVVDSIANRNVSGISRGNTFGCAGQFCKQTCIIAGRTSGCHAQYFITSVNRVGSGSVNCFGGPIINRCVSTGSTSS